MKLRNYITRWQALPEWSVHNRPEIVSDVESLGKELRHSIQAYDQASDPEERQDFCWMASEADVPDETVCRLADLLHEDDLLDIDKITISTEELRGRLNDRFGLAADPKQFRAILDALEAVTVRMIDDDLHEDELGDMFFIHE